MPDPHAPSTAPHRAAEPVVPAPCGRRFDDELLSGYLDGALLQSEEQRVRLHLEDCAPCRAEFAELTTLREAAMTTRFTLPADDQWDETPRGAGSRWSRSIGWILLVAWLVGIAGFAAWALVTGPASLLEKLFLFAGVTGVGLLFVSVLIDRLRTRTVDLYRRVLK